jgi:hypothetical protein
MLSASHPHSFCELCPYPGRLIVGLGRRKISWGVALTAAQHPAASHHLPWFLTAPGNSDILFMITTVVVVLVVLGLGVVFFRLHSPPERMGHKKIQFEIVAVLCLLSLFTHIHLFWVAGLLLALIDVPDFQTPLRRMADSLDRLTATDGQAESDAEPKPAQQPKPGA